MIDILAILVADCHFKEMPIFVCMPQPNREQTCFSQIPMLFLPIHVHYSEQKVKKVTDLSKVRLTRYKQCTVMKNHILDYVNFGNLTHC